MPEDEVKQSILGWILRKEPRTYMNLLMIVDQMMIHIPKQGLNN